MIQKARVMKGILLALGLLILFGGEVLRVYFIMPFPGSQHNDTVALAYWISKYILWIRLFALLLIAVSLSGNLARLPGWQKGVLLILLFLYLAIYYFFNYRFEADKMFYQPRQKLFLPASADTTDKQALVIGVVNNGEARAYPIQVIGYHHQVRDTIGGKGVMITYCTVCRTGRAYEPVVNGKPEYFRLVGMDHFNAMFEDETTKSWWQQATGVAIAGPLKGAVLREFPSAQLPLSSWLRQHPNSLIMQPDTAFKKDYHDLVGYDKGTIKSSLEKRDSLSWKPKSWVIGVLHQQRARAYDWNDLVNKRLIQDSMAGLPLLIWLESDTVSFHVYDRRVNGSSLLFEKSGPAKIVDQSTHSIWNADGLCISGALMGEQLAVVPSYNEFWHSWQTFHKNTGKG